MNDPVITYVLLCGSAFLAGAINSVAGGGTLLTFPTLMAALSGNGVVANATSTVAVMPGSLAGSWAYRRELQDKRRVFLRLLGPSLLGGAIGALLVTQLPDKVFNMAVPWLILAAALLFMLNKPIQRWVGAHHVVGPPSSRTVGIIVICQFFVAIYGGYFGAGIGILMLSALAFMSVGDIHHMNGLKTILAAAINGTAVVVVIIEDKVHWPYALAIAVTCILGGYVGASLARRLKPVYVRWIVIVIGFGLSAYYFWKQFG